MLVSALRGYLRQTLDHDRRRRLVKLQALHFRRLQHEVFRAFIGTDLAALALVYNTDKWGSHWYARYYERFFAPRRSRRLNVLEIGIGGYRDPEAGGGSLRMWRTYFPKSRIYGIDIHDKRPHDEARIKTFCGSQADPAFLARVVQQIGTLDIVIDDGSHQNEHVLTSFGILFPHLSDGGLYVIEDTQTSYWRRAGGSSDDLNSRSTSMGFLKSLVDGLNHTEYELPGYEPTYYDRQIVGISFFHNIVFIEKGFNAPETDYGGRAVQPSRWRQASSRRRLS